MPSQQSRPQTIFSTIKDDIRNTHAFRTLKKESNEIKDFYLTDKQREQLKNISRGKRTFYIAGWVLKAMFFKLTPLRRLLFVIGVVMILTVRVNENGTAVGGNGLIGGALLVLVILLELKDKLLAHDELQEGRHIQELLMPERTPNINGWSAWLYTRSANEVCGDLIDFLRMEDGRVGIAVADVAGKGLHAALLTTKLQATIRALAFDKQSLPSLVQNVNTIFHRDSPSHIFASLLYAELTENESTLRFVNAGHFPAMVVRSGIVEETGKGDAALGLMRTAVFAEHSVLLNGGDLFVIYSDGLTEAKSEAGNFFGKERFVKLLQSAKGTPQQVGELILREVDWFIGMNDPSDDLSIIILQKN